MLRELSEQAKARRTEESAAAKKFLGAKSAESSLWTEDFPLFGHGMRKKIDYTLKRILSEKYKSSHAGNGLKSPNF